MNVTIRSIIPGAVPAEPTAAGPRHAGGLLGQFVSLLLNRGGRLPATELAGDLAPQSTATAPPGTSEAPAGDPAEPLPEPVDPSAAGLLALSILPAAPLLATAPSVQTSASPLERVADGGIVRPPGVAFGSLNTDAEPAAAWPTADLPSDAPQPAPPHLARDAAPAEAMRIGPVGQESTAPSLPDARERVAVAAESLARTTPADDWPSEAARPTGAQALAATPDARDVAAEIRGTVPLTARQAAVPTGDRPSEGAQASMLGDDLVELAQRPSPVSGPSAQRGDTQARPPDVAPQAPMEMPTASIRPTGPSDVPTFQAGSVAADRHAAAPTFGDQSLTTSLSRSDSTRMQPDDNPFIAPSTRHNSEPVGMAVEAPHAERGAPTDALLPTEVEIDRRPSATNSIRQDAPDEPTGVSLAPTGEIVRPVEARPASVVRLAEVRDSGDIPAASGRHGQAEIAVSRESRTVKASAVVDAGEGLPADAEQTFQQQFSATASLDADLGQLLGSRRAARPVRGTNDPSPQVAPDTRPAGGADPRDSRIDAVVALPVARPGVADAWPVRTQSSSPIDHQAAVAPDSRGEAEPRAGADSPAAAARQVEQLGGIRLESPAAMPEPREPDGARAVREQFIARVLEAAQVVRSGGTTSLRVRLHPEELGAVDVRLVERNGVVVVRIDAATADARGALETGLDQLRRGLTDGGLAVQRIEVTAPSRVGDAGLGPGAQHLQFGQSSGEQWSPSGQAQHGWRQPLAPMSDAARRALDRPQPGDEGDARHMSERATYGIDYRV